MARATATVMRPSAGKYKRLTDATKIFHTTRAPTARLRTIAADFGRRATSGTAATPTGMAKSARVTGSVTGPVERESKGKSINTADAIAHAAMEPRTHPTPRDRSGLPLPPIEAKGMLSVASTRAPKRSGERPADLDRLAATSRHVKLTHYRASTS